jgi:hypothetical protein
VRAIIFGSHHARDPVTAEADPADTHTGPGTVAAESAASAAGWKINCGRRPAGDVIGLREALRAGSG